MTYKKHKKFLIVLIAVLALLYTGSLIFNSDLSNSRSASFIWLESRLAGRASRIVINTQEINFELVKRTDQWFVSYNGSEYPARKLRVEDFLSIFTKRSAWPVRSSNASSHERFGLGGQASRITIYGENTVLLDLLLGDDDSTGREAYFRKAGQNDVRSGDNNLRTYVTGAITGWYNLRLIPESADTAVGSVQRLSVYNGEDFQVFSRRNRGWTVSGIEVANPDQNSIENYLRTILNTEGDNFADSAEELEFNHSRIVLEFGNGRTVTVSLGESDETGRRAARVSGGEYIYSIPSWAASRLFRDASDFEMQ